MKQRLLWCFLFLLGTFILLIPKKLLSQSTDKPSISISSSANYGGGGGLIAYPSIGEVKIDVWANKTSGSAKVEIYSVTLDDVLNYLVHDNKYQQINPDIEVSKFTHISNVDINLIEQKSLTVSLPLPEKGLFFIRAKQNDLSAGTFVVRSTLGSMAREAKDTLVIWSQDFTTKRSVVGAKVKVYNLEKNKNVIGEASSDNEGVVSIPLTESADLVIVENGDSVAILPLNARYLNGAYSWTTFSPNKIDRKYFVFTDRPLYKPGDTVKFKAIVRDDDDARYSISRGSVMVAIGSGYDNSSFIYKTNLQIDVNGYISGSYVLPKNATTGEYRLIINPKTISSSWGDYQSYDDSINFKIENYRKPEYFIEAESAMMEVVRGDDISVDLKGEYYSGQPLSNETVNYKIYTNQGFADYESYYPISASNFYHAWGQTEIETGSVTLDKRGKAKVTLPTNKNDSLGKYQLYFVEFTYADASGNQSLTAVNVLVRSGEFSLYRDGYTGYGGKTNEKLNLPLVVKGNLQGVNLSQKVEIGVVRRWWQKYNDENNKYPQYREEKENVGNFFLTSDKSGKVVFSFTPTKEGKYELSTKMTDSRGNVITKTFSLWVSDKYANYFGSNNNSTIRITTDKKTYLPGDKAIINLSSDIPDRDIYFGVERAYQDRYQVVHMNGNSADVELIISDHDIPNIFLVAKSFEASGLQGDIQNVAIDTTGKKIVYTVNTDKKLYAPGDEVTVNVEAKDSAGNPVESNLALWAVDKSLYALADVNYGDVFDRFWQARGDDTQQSHSLEGITVIGGAEKGGCFLPGTKILMANNFSKSIEEVKVGDKVLTRLSPKSTKMVETKVLAIHRTSALGYLVINTELKLTDNHLLLVNGKWAEARTIRIGDELLGIGDKKINVYSVEFLNLPSKVYNITTDIYHSYFANGIYVHNEKGGGPRDSFADTAYWNASINTGSDGRIQVKFKLPDNLTTWVLTTIGASSDTKAGQGFTEIKVSKDLAIRPVLPNILGEKDTITVSALVNNYTDLESKTIVKLKTDAGEVLSPLSQNVIVLPNDFAQVAWQIKVGEAKPKVKFEFSVSDDKGRSDAIIQNLEVRSIGFWEQKSDFKSGASSFTLQIPNVSYDINKSKVEVSLSSTVLGSLPASLKYLINYPYGCVEQTTSALVSKLMARKYPIFFAEALKSESKYETLAEGLDKLKELQNYNGSWSWWWKGSKTEPFVSAYVFRILNEAKRQGVAVDEGMYSKAQNYLSENFEGADFENKIIKAYGLSFAVDSKVHRSIEGGLTNVSDDFLAMAVYANLTAGITDSSKNGLDTLLGRMSVSDYGVNWNAGSLDRFGSREASTALAIQALAKSGSHQEEAAKAINYLMKNRYHDYWGSTFTTAQTIMAVTDYSLAVKESEANFLYRVMSGGEQLSSGMFSGSKSVPVSLNIDLRKAVKNGEIKIEKNGEGELYTTVNQKWWIKDIKSPEVSNGVKIVKTIENVKGEAYNFVPGDLVKVNLEISFLNEDTSSRGYAIIEDRLPSGLIPVNTNLLNESENQGSDDYIEKQFLNDGVIIPIYYTNNSQTYSYFARIINAGNFYMPPVYYSLMYYPETWARSESSTFMVEDTIKINPLSGVKDINTNFRNYLTLKNLIVGVILVAILSGLVFWSKKHEKNIKKDEKVEPPQEVEPPQSISNN